MAEICARRWSRPAVHEFRLDKADATPLYRQLADNLRSQIERGGIGPGRALPSERDLSVMTGMSRVTVRKGVEMLIDEGLLLRRHGSGTFVAPRIEAPGAGLSSFTDDARARGDEPGVIWMVRTHAAPTAEEAGALGVPETARVARLGRVRLSGGEPLAIEHAVVPAAFLPDLHDLGDSLYAALGARGFRPVSGTQRLRASLATPTEAAMLSIREGSELLRIERLTRLADGRPVEFTRSAYRGDRYDFVSPIGAPAE
jgi:GntR family transcriptional regulator